MARIKVKLVTVNVDGQDVTAKMCTGCMKTKPLQEFNKSSDGSVGGKQSKCKQCKSEWFKNNYKPSDKITRLSEMVVNGETVLAKVCTVCKELKPLVEYSNVNNGVGGKLSKCKECGNKKCREYKEKNREKIREYDRLKWKNNTDTERYRKAMRHNKMKSSERYKVWASKNKELIGIKNKVSYYKRKSLKNTLSIDQINETLEHFGHKCALSGSETFVLDHFIAINTASVGTVQGNIIPLSPFLNTSKKDRNPFEWVNWSHIQEQIIPGSFDKVIKYLAEANEMTEEQYKDFVYSHY